MEPISMVGAGVSVLASLFGELIAAGKEEEAQRIREQIVDSYGEDVMAEVEAMTPAFVKESAVGGISEDPRLRQRQLSALDALRAEADYGGNSPEDMAAIEAARNAVSRNAQSLNASLTDSMTKRGGANSGLLAALRTQSAQDTSNTLGNMSLQSQMGARQRAIAALRASLAGAGDVRGQDFGVAKTKASAVDAMNTFNEANRAQGQRAKLDARLGVLQSRNNAKLGVAGGLQSQANRARQMAGAVGGAAQDVAALGLDEYENQRRLKP